MTSIPIALIIAISCYLGRRCFPRRFSGTAMVAARVECVYYLLVGTMEVLEYIVYSSSYPAVLEYEY